MKRGCSCFLVLIFLLTACAANVETQKRLVEDKRNVAGAYIGQKNYTAALRELLEAEKIYSDDPYLQHDLGFVYMQKERSDLAIEHFKKALALKPDYSAARNNLGVAYLKSGQWDQAIACFKELSENLLYTTPQNPLVNLGRAYYQKREFTQSENYYNRALKLYDEGLRKDATYVMALHGLSLTCLATDRSQKAVLLLERAVRLAPRVADLYFDLGRAYAMAGEFSKAVRAYDKVVELIPGRSMALEAASASDDLKRSHNLK